MAVANNADDYAATRQNIFFPGVIPDLDGQCVSLVKWFLQEMTSVPNPQAARGDARYVGQTLVAQGHAVEVPYSERRRGDIVGYEFGTYGHIAVQLSGGRVFEENVNMGGVQSKVVAGSTVYASRIGSEAEPWRANKNPHIYRIKSYNEEGEHMAVITIENQVAISEGTQGTQPQNAEDTQFINKEVDQATLDNMVTYWANKGRARQAALEARIAELEAQVGSGQVKVLINNEEYVKKG